MAVHHNTTQVLLSVDPHYLIPPTDRCPYELLAAQPDRELLMYATSELGEVRIMVWTSTLASDSGEMDSVLFLLSLGVSRETADTKVRSLWITLACSLGSSQGHWMPVFISQKVEYAHEILNLSLACVAWPQKLHHLTLCCRCNWSATLSALAFRLS